MMILRIDDVIASKSRASGPSSRMPEMDME
jgi:hypothetical protein